jgi:predicted negative regulator of RcsB-dependent stress response
MSVVDIHASEEEQVAALKKWVGDYGRYIVLGLVVGLGGMYGFRAYEAHKVSVAQEASDQYEAVRKTIALDDLSLAREQGQAVIDSHPGSAYAVHTALVLANLEVDDAKPEAAVTQLKWILSSSADDALKHVARLRLARVQLFSQNYPETAMGTLKVKDEGQFTALYAELRGDILVEQGNTAAAREAYQAALDAWTTDMGTPLYLKMKLDDLAGSTSAS